MHVWMNEFEIECEDKQKMYIGDRWHESNETRWKNMWKCLCVLNKWWSECPQNEFKLIVAKQNLMQKLSSLFRFHPWKGLSEWIERWIDWAGTFKRIQQSRITKASQIESFNLVQVCKVQSGHSLRSYFKWSRLLTFYSGVTVSKPRPIALHLSIWHSSEASKMIRLPHFEFC